MPQVTVATPTEIETLFPRTVHHQPDVLGMVGSVAMHDYAADTDNHALQALAVEQLGAISGELEHATCGLYSIVETALQELGFDGLVAQKRARVKSGRRTMTKAVGNFFAGKHDPVTDIGAIEVEFVPGVTDTETKRIAHALQSHFGLPEVYPSGTLSIKEGGYCPEKPDDNLDSVEGYKDVKIILPLMLSGRIRVGEVKLLTAEQAVQDVHTRSKYEERRDGEFEQLKRRIGRTVLYGRFLEHHEED